MVDYEMIVFFQIGKAGRIRSLHRIALGGSPEHRLPDGGGAARPDVPAEHGKQQYQRENQRRNYGAIQLFHSLPSNRAQDAQQREHDGQEG